MNSLEYNNNLLSDFPHPKSILIACLFLIINIILILLHPASAEKGDVTNMNDVFLSLLTVGILITTIQPLIILTRIVNHKSNNEVKLNFIVILIILFEMAYVPYLFLISINPDISIRIGLDFANALLYTAFSFKLLNSNVDLYGLKNIFCWSLMLGLLFLLLFDLTNIEEISALSFLYSFAGFILVIISIISEVLILFRAYKEYKLLDE